MATCNSADIERSGTAVRYSISSKVDTVTYGEVSFVDHNNFGKRSITIQIERGTNGKPFTLVLSDYPSVLDIAKTLAVYRKNGIFDCHEAEELAAQVLGPSDELNASISR